MTFEEINAACVDLTIQLPLHQTSFCAMRATGATWKAHLVHTSSTVFCYVPTYKAMEATSRSSLQPLPHSGSLRDPSGPVPFPHTRHLFTCTTFICHATLLRSRRHALMQWPTMPPYTYNQNCPPPQNIYYLFPNTCPKLRTCTRVRAVENCGAHRLWSS